MDVAVEKIQVKCNPRTDFGDIDELAASVREKGIIEPLVVKTLSDGSYELIAGERRLRAAKAAGLADVPVTVRDISDDDIEEVKLIENIHRKDFNSLEEAKAFKAYLDKTGSSIDTLAQKIAKPRIYVERRLEMLKLPAEVQKAVSSGKILMGHALVIARLEGKAEQKEMLKTIIEEKLSVGNSESELKRQDTSISLSDAQFDKSGCEGCKSNGGEQSLLFETGAEIKGVCLKKKCFLDKTQKWVDGQIKALQDKGVNVLSHESLESLKVKQQVSEWDSDFKVINKKLHLEPENYAVAFETDYYGRIRKTLWCLNPKARKTKAEKPSGEAAKSGSASDRLTNKVSEFKRQFLIGKTNELMKPSSKEAKAMTLFALLSEALSYSDRGRQEEAEKLIKAEKIGTTSYGTVSPKFSKILDLEENDIDRLISAASGFWVKTLGEELDHASARFGVDLTEHFTITEEYLKPYTKDGLISLAKEIGLAKFIEDKGIEKWDTSKRTELVGYFLNEGYDLKGKVPKVLKKAGR